MMVIPPYCINKVECPIQVIVSRSLFFLKNWGSLSESSKSTAFGVTPFHHHLIRSENDFFVEGCVEGYILNDKQGKSGFGYDPIFFVPEIDMSLAEMSSDIKNKISHRGIAIDKFKNKINQIFNV